MKAIDQAIADGTAKVLTVAIAQTLKGKKIQTKYLGYQGQDGTEEFIVGDIVSQYDLALKNHDPAFSKHGNQAAYWESYMKPHQLEEVKTNFVLLSADGLNYNIVAHTKYGNCFNEPTFTCSDADREVFFTELNAN